jgi:hypothetical protein
MAFLKSPPFLDAAQVGLKRIAKNIGDARFETIRDQQFSPVVPN